MKTCQQLLGLILLFIVACRAEAWTVKLSEGWHVQSSDKVQDDGAHLSTPGASTAGWYSATVPSTLMGVLTAKGAEPEPLTREDYQHTDRRQFDVSWWYRTTFTIPCQQQGQHTLLQFDGISYRANIWLNGHQIATSQQVAGPYRQLTFDIRVCRRQVQFRHLHTRRVNPDLTCQLGE